MDPEEIANRIANDYLPVGTIRTAEFLAIQKDIAAALRSYGDARAKAERAMERERCAEVVQIVGAAKTYTDMEYASGYAADDIVARIAATIRANAE